MTNFEHALLESLTTAILVFDESMHLTYANPAAEMLFAMSGRHMLGMPAQTLVPCGDEHMSKRLEQIWASGNALTEREISVQFPGQSSLVTIDCTMQPFDKDGDKSMLVEIQRVDRQVRISREEQFIAQQEASHQLIRGLAHEIKNPLGGIRGAAQLLKEELSENELSEYTKIIIKEADRLRALVDRMLGPRALPHLAELNIHAVLERVRQLVQVEYGDKIHIERNYDPSIPELWADEDQLIQAFLNIVRNAAIALDGEGSICVESRIRRQYTIGSKLHRLVVQVDITDHGPGIPGHLQEQIFLPMVTGRAEGTGLGLTIAQSLITAHDGLIECRSDVGETIFSIFIPLEKHR